MKFRKISVLILLLILAVGVITSLTACMKEENYNTKDEISSFVAALEEKISQSKSEYNSALTALKAEYDSKINDAAADIEALDAEYEAKINLLTEKHNGELAAINALIEELKSVDAAQQEQIDELLIKVSQILNIPIHSITFDSAGGNYTPDVQHVMHGEKGKKPSEPSRKGYKFLGWFIEDEKWSFIGYTVTEDTELVAKWEPITYKINYVLGANATSPTNPTEYTVESDLSFEAPEREGYTFAGWTYSNQTTPTLTPNLSGSIGDVTLTAHWSIIKYSIIYDLAGGENSRKNPVTYTVETEFTLENPTHPCNTFLGWTWFDQSIPQKNPTFPKGTTGLQLFVANWQEGAHVDNNNDRRCDTCNKGLSGEGIDESYYPWNSGAPVRLLFQMTDNSAKRELPSGCNRYLAGGNKAENGTLDDMIYERNIAAYDATNVFITYKYYPDETGYGHGSVAELMINDSLSLSTGNLPDIYCNFTYDMGAASIKGAFANLKSGFHNYAGANYFEFLTSDYNERVDNLGYMYDYMTSTTLNEDKMYILASDYFTDLVRAFFVVPVNKAMLESIINTPEAVLGENPLIEEIDGIPGYSLNDFYGMVRDKKWTYDMVKRYSNAIYESADGETDKKSLNDKKIGFAISAYGYSKSGILYSNELKVIKKYSDEDFFSYEYPSESEQLAAVFTAISDLVQSEGVMIVTHADAIGNKYGDTAALGIRNRFCESHILFGDIITLAALEESKYQTFKGEDGFGVLPVPLYHEIPEGSDETYLTAIHNAGRAGAIAANTLHFAECTAFLNYQSTHSTDILDEYYKENFQHSAEYGSTENIEMLRYIRSNVRSTFDKFIEDVIEYRTENDPNNQSGTDDQLLVWHSFLSKDTMWQYDIRTVYDSVRRMKQDMLDVIQNDFLENTPK